VSGAMSAIGPKADFPHALADVRGTHCARQQVGAARRQQAAELGENFNVRCETEDVA